MKTFFLILVFSITLHLFSQENNREKIYENGRIYFVFLESNYEVFNETPFGIDATIIYNDFFKSYRIYFIDNNGIEKQMYFTYVQTTEDGVIRMSDTADDIYLLKDELSYRGQLIFTHEKTLDGYIVLTHIKGATLKK